MARHFADDIMDRATKTFDPVVHEGNFLRWVTHWREVARQYKDELLDEGLVKSAEAVETFIHHNALSQRSVEEYKAWEDKYKAAVGDRA